MDAHLASPPGHSADVRMELRVNGLTLPISHLGPDFLILSSPADHPSADGEITLTIDGQTSRWPIHLPNGLSSSARRIAIARVM